MVHTRHSQEEADERPWGQIEFTDDDGTTVYQCSGRNSFIIGRNTSCSMRSQARGELDLRKCGRRLSSPRSGQTWLAGGESGRTRCRFGIC